MYTFYTFVIFYTFSAIFTFFLHFFYIFYMVCPINPVSPISQVSICSTSASSSFWSLLLPRILSVISTLKYVWLIKVNFQRVALDCLSYNLKFLLLLYAFVFLALWKTCTFLKSQHFNCPFQPGICLTNKCVFFQRVALDCLSYHATASDNDTYWLARWIRCATLNFQNSKYFHVWFSKLDFSTLLSQLYRWIRHDTLNSQNSK